MLLSYLWQTKTPGNPASRRLFSEALARERDLFAHAWGRRPAVSIWSHENLFVGQLRYEPGVEGFEAWVERGTVGLAWGGVCESFLGDRFSATRVEELVETCHRRPEDLISWDGRFSLTCWDGATGRVTLATGATQSPTLWYGEGPGGWAVASRAVPVLELVGRPKVPNRSTIDLFLLSGYLIGEDSLFEGVERVSSRRVLTFDGQSPPRKTVYASPLDVMRSQRPPKDRKDAIEICRSRLIRRVEVQNRATSEGILLLTGGRDSRLIAAAAARAGYEGHVHSGGSLDSPTVTVAGTVASALGLKRHPGWGDNYFPEGTAPDFSMENLTLWTRFSEGVETIRHALTWHDFFARATPCPARREVSFHGLAGELGRGSAYKELTPRALRKADATPLARGQTRSQMLAFWGERRPDAWELLDATFDRFEAELGESVDVAMWLELFSWQRRYLQWGEDAMLVRSAISWTWTPLHDRVLLATYLALAPEIKYGSRFVEELTVAIAPELKDVPYDRAEWGPPGVRTALKRARRRLGRLKRRATRNTRSSAPQALDGEGGRQDVWDIVFRRDGDSFWPEIVGEEALRDLIERDPNSEALWNLATMELFMRTGF